MSTHCAQPNGGIHRSRSAGRIAALALLVAALGGVPARASEVAEQHEDEGSRCYREKQYECSVREFLAAYNIDQQPRYLFNIAQAYKLLGDSTEAVSYYQRYLEQSDIKIDPTIKADIERYIRLMAPQQAQKGGAGGGGVGPEPTPVLVAEEIVDLEELSDQIVKDYKAGNTALALELLNQVREVYNLRRDPLVLYYLGRTYDRMDKRKDALDYYRRYLASQAGDPQRRSESQARVVVLTPPPPGRKYLKVALPLMALGLAGVVTGAGLYVETSSNFDKYQTPGTEQDKRDLRDHGNTLGLGSIIAYSAGGAILGTGFILFTVALKKGLRQKQEAAPREGPPQAAERLGLLPPATGQASITRLGVQPLLGGGGVLLQGAF